MTDDSDRFDEELAALETSLRSENHERAFACLTTFDADLTRYVRTEEHLVFPALERFAAVPPATTEKMRGEHRSLRKLVDSLWELLARRDKGRGLEVLASLRSVLLFHVTKEEWVLQPLLHSGAAH